MTTGWPRRDARSNAAPSRVTPTTGGAGWSTAALGPPRIEPATSTTPTVVTTAMARASRIGRRGVADPAYCSVAVPVMFEWIVQTNVYEPAGSDGTS